MTSAVRVDKCERVSPARPLLSDRKLFQGEKNRGEKQKIIRLNIWSSGSGVRVLCASEHVTTYFHCSRTNCGRQCLCTLLIYYYIYTYPKSQDTHCSEKYREHQMLFGH